MPAESKRGDIRFSQTVKATFIQEVLHPGFTAKDIPKSAKHIIITLIPYFQAVIRKEHEKRRII
jgi:hypothetical protein